MFFYGQHLLVHIPKKKNREILTTIDKKNMEEKTNEVY